MENADTDGKIFVGKSDEARISHACAGQPARARHRRDRHRQDRDAAGAGRRLFARRASRCSPPTSRATSPASPQPGEAKEAFVKRAKSMGFDYEPDEFPVVFWDLFGEQGHPIRATDLGDGAAAAVAPAGPQRRAGGRAQHLLPRRRRAGAAAARSQGSARDARLSRRARRRADHAIRQRVEADHRHHPAPAAGAGEPGRRQVLRRAGAGAQGFHAHRPRRARHHQHPRRRQADGEPAALRHLPAVAAVRAVRGAARSRRSGQAEARASSSTRRICCSTMRRRRCSTRSSRWCG